MWKNTEHVSGKYVALDCLRVFYMHFYNMGVQQTNR